MEGPFFTCLIVLCDSRHFVEVLDDDDLFLNSLSEYIDDWHISESTKPVNEVSVK